MHNIQLSSKHRAFYIFDMIFHCVLSPCLSYREAKGDWMGLKSDKERAPSPIDYSLLGVNT